MILKSTAKNIRKAAEIIRASGVVAFPTETVYGLGANAFDPAAVEKIFKAKNRPHFDPLIVHVANPEMLALIVRHTPRSLKLTDLLTRFFWPGPLTLVLRKSPLIPGLVTAGMETVAVRMPSHPVALRFIRACGVPVAAPSANRFGAVSPTAALHVQEQIGGKVPLILDGGTSDVGVESTILDLTGKRPVILRPGGITAEALGKVLRLKPGIGRRRGLSPRAPGQLKSHYAPSIPLRLAGRQELRDLARTADARTAFILLSRLPGLAAGPRVRCLSKTGNLEEAARGLYRALHDLDRPGIRIIYAERPVGRGLGAAILDRLTRASGKG